jgi:hypothetical protein
MQTRSQTRNPVQSTDQTRSTDQPRSTDQRMTTRSQVRARSPSQVQTISHVQLRARSPVQFRSHLPSPVKLQSSTQLILENGHKMTTRSRVNVEEQINLPALRNAFVEEPTIIRTRSQSRNQAPLPTYDVEIDFDEASEAWLRNKKSIGNGQYRYIS